MKKNFYIIIFLLLITFLLPNLTFAGIVPCATKDNSAPCTLCHLIVGIKGLVDFGTTILVIIAITAIVISGIIYIASAGSQKMIQQAKSFMLSAILGCVFFLGAWLIVSVTLNIVGAKNATSWNRFECDTTSSAPTGPAPASSTPASPDLVSDPGS